MVTNQTRNSPGKKLEEEEEGDWETESGFLFLCEN
jgi:hypothetical protein